MKNDDDFTVLRNVSRRGKSKGDYVYVGRSLSLSADLTKKLLKNKIISEEGRRLEIGYNPSKKAFRFTKATTGPTSFAVGLIKGPSGIVQRASLKPLPASFIALRPPRGYYFPSAENPDEYVFGYLFDHSHSKTEKQAPQAKKMPLPQSNNLQSSTVYWAFLPPLSKRDPLVATGRFVKTVDKIFNKERQEWAVIEPTSTNYLEAYPRRTVVLVRLDKVTFKENRS